MLFRSRSFIFSTDQKLVIKADNDLNNPPVMTVDGQEAIDIEQDCEIHVSKSDMVTKLIKIKPENFYEILSKKIIERRA